jgi:hypothetical protein
MTTIALPEEKEGLLSLKQAAQEIGIARKTMDYYVRTLSLETTKFPFDNSFYVRAEDVASIKALRDAAAARRMRQ